MTDTLRRVIYHEAGHATVAYLLGWQATINTNYTIAKYPRNCDKSDLLTFLMGGRASEFIKFNIFDTSSLKDIQQALQISGMDFDAINQASERAIASLRDNWQLVERVVEGVEQCQSD